MKKISIILAIIFILSAFSGCADKISNIISTSDNSTTNVVDNPSTTNTEIISTEEQTEPSTAKKRDSWDADYLLELQDRVEADYRNCGEVSKELGITPNEDFLNRNFKDITNINVMLIHENLNYLTLKYLENELDESLFIWDSEAFEKYEFDALLFPNIAAKDDCLKKIKDNTFTYPTSGVVIEIIIFKLYVNDNQTAACNYVPENLTLYPHEYECHRVMMQVNKDYANIAEYQKKIIRGSYDDEIIPIELRFLFEDLMLYKTHFMRMEVCCDTFWASFHPFFNINLYPGILKRELLKEVYGTPDENGRYDLSVKTPLIGNWNFDIRYPGEQRPTYDEVVKKLKEGCCGIF